MLAFAIRRTTTRADAEDIAAETLAIAWRKIDRLPEAAPEQRTWLYAIARNVLSNHRRGNTRATNLTKLLSTVDTNNAPGADDGVVNLSDIEVAVEALGMLSDKDREVLLLAVWEDLPKSEIAAVLSTSKPNVYLRLHRARKRLRAQFAAVMQEPSPSGHQLLRRETEKTAEQEKTG